MSELAVTITAYVLILVAAVALAALPLVRSLNLPSVGDILRNTMARRSAMIGLVVAWWWLGWHFVTGH